MLAETSAYLARASAMVTIVARRPSVLALPLRTDAYECAVDWNDRDAFVRTVAPRCERHPPDIVLLWMHETGRASFLWLLGKLSLSRARVVHVLGSVRADPRAFDSEVTAIVAASSAMSYVRVVLGSIELSDGSRRWLTNREINAGTIAAIESDTDVTIGTIADGIERTP